MWSFIFILVFRYSPLSKTSFLLMFSYSFFSFLRIIFLLLPFHSLIAISPFKILISSFGGDLNVFDQGGLH
jgi:hypothetical protein